MAAVVLWFSAPQAVIYIIKHTWLICWKMLRLTPHPPRKSSRATSPLPTSSHPLRLRLPSPQTRERDIVRVVPCRYQCIVCPWFSKLFFFFFFFSPSSPLTSFHPLSYAFPSLSLFPLQSTMYIGPPAFVPVFSAASTLLRFVSHFIN